MIRFIVRRILISIPVLLVVITLAFLLIRLAPGSPFAAERKLDPVTQAELEKKYHLNGSLLDQHLMYGKNLLQGDFGQSLKYPNRSVKEIIGQTLPVSASIGFIALVLALGMGICIGSYAAVNHNQIEDRLAMLFALMGICLPTFVIAPIFVVLLAIKIPAFPVAGWGTVSHYVLPSICLAIPFAAYCARLMRASMLDVLQQDFVRTARAKGLSERSVVMLHALKVAILPLVSYSGPLAANILTGSLVVEQIFKIPGLGPFFVNSVFNKDVFLASGTVIVYSVLLIGFNLLADILYQLLDRRIKLE